MQWRWKGRPLGELWELRQRRSKFLLRDDWVPSDQQLGSRKRNRFLEEDSSDLGMSSLWFLQFMQI